jgi:hypothetical protein
VASWLETHPYLLWGLVGLLLLALGLALCPQRLRWPSLLSGLLALVPAVTGAWTGRHYWSPVRIWPFFVSLEDFVYSFAIGGLAWLLGTWPVHTRMVLNIRPRRLLLRYFMGCVLAATLTIGASLLESKPMYGYLLPVVGVGLVVFYLRPALYRVGVWGLAGYALLHFALLKASFTLTPSFAGTWHVVSLWGPKLWAIPLDEIAWSAAVGAVWPASISYVFDARLVLPDQRGRQASE